jgi:hypothetical protein
MKLLMELFSKKQLYRLQVKLSCAKRALTVAASSDRIKVLNSGLWQIAANSDLLPNHDKYK